MNLFHHGLQILLKIFSLLILPQESSQEKADMTFRSTLYRLSEYQSNQNLRNSVEFLLASRTVDCTQALRTWQRTPPNLHRYPAAIRGWRAESPCNLLNRHAGAAENLRQDPQNQNPNQDNQVKQPVGGFDCPSILTDHVKSPFCNAWNQASNVCMTGAMQLQAEAGQLTRPG